MVIIDFRHEHLQRFKELNFDWISEHFEIEEIDRQVLNDPYKYILNNGGAILLAEENGEIIGGCALMNEGHGIFELTKMVVDRKHRGKKIGFEVGLAALQKAKELTAKKVILFSNTIHNGNAINLYYKLGFKKVALGESIFKRADIKMEIILSS